MPTKPKEPTKTEIMEQSTEVTTAPEPTGAETPQEPKSTEPTAPKPAPKKKVSLTAIDLNELVEVQSCFYGKLFYQSRAGYSITWGEYGSTQPVPVSELVVMRNEQPKFFSKNWVLLVSDNAPAVLNALQLEKYYKHISSLESFDELFYHKPEEAADLIANLSDDMKETVARRAFELIKEGTIDSVKLIEALEDALGYELRE